MAQKHQHTQQLLPQIKKMLEEGMTQKEVENTLGLTGYRPEYFCSAATSKPVCNRMCCLSCTGIP